MRTWGRVPIVVSAAYGGSIGSFVIGKSAIGNGSDEKKWVEVTTDTNGNDDAVWLTALAQVLQLGLNESPIFGNWGIPAYQSVVTQVMPDYYVTLTQQNFAKNFAALSVSSQSTSEPIYAITVTANPGAILMDPLPV
jgi:hypothetical protein